MDCSRWSKLVKVVDDQDGCEWVNVPSGTGSLRQSLTKGRKMVLCVLEMRYIVPRIWVALFILVKHCGGRQKVGFLKLGIPRLPWCASSFWQLSAAFTV